MMPSPQTLQELADKGKIPQARVDEYVNRQAYLNAPFDVSDLDTNDIGAIRKRSEEVRHQRLIELGYTPGIDA